MIFNPLKMPFIVITIAARRSNAVFKIKARLECWRQCSHISSRAKYQVIFRTRQWRSKSDYAWICTWTLTRIQNREKVAAPSRRCVPMSQASLATNKQNSSAILLVPPHNLRYIWNSGRKTLQTERGQPDLSVSPQNEASREEKGGENVRWDEIEWDGKRSEPSIWTAQASLNKGDRRVGGVSSSTLSGHFLR